MSGERQKGSGGSRAGSGRKATGAKVPKPMAFRFSPETAEKLRRLAENRGLPMVRVLAELVDKAVD